MAKTLLNQVLLKKLARAEDPEANLENYSRMVDILCRLNREIASTQKQRDDSRRTLRNHRTRRAFSASGAAESLCRTRVEVHGRTMNTIVILGSPVRGAPA